MKTQAIAGAILILGMLVFMSALEPKSYTPEPLFFNRAGRITQQPRIWYDTITPTTGNGYSIDISSASFSHVQNIDVSAERNTATVQTIPMVSVKSNTTTAVIVNIFEPSTSLVTILGFSVLSGYPVQFVGTPSTVTLNVKVIGY